MKSINKWLLASFFFILTVAFVDVFLNIKIFTQTQDYVLVGNYMLFYFLGIFLGTIISSILLPVIGFSLLFIIIAISITISPMFYQLYSVVFFDNLALFGAIAGAGYGMFVIPASDVAISLVPKDKQTKYYSNLNILWTITYLAVPAFVSFSISSSTEIYAVYFVAILSVIGLLLMQNFFINLDEKINTKLFWKNLSEHNLTASTLNFFYGLRQGVFWAFLGAATFSIVDNINIWGLYMIFLKVIQIISSWIFKKVKNQTILVQIYFTSGILYAFFLVLLFVNLTPNIFLVFIALNAVYVTIANICHFRLVYSIEDSDLYMEKHAATYSVINEASIGLGRIVAVAGLLYIFSTTSILEKNMLIYLILILASLIPHLNVWVAKHAKKTKNIYFP